MREPQLAEARARLAGAEASLAEARLNLSRTRVSAPFDGRVRSKAADLGQFVGAGSRLGRVFSTTLAEVSLPLSDRELSLLGIPLAFEAAPGEGPSVRLSAVVAGALRTWDAHIARTASAIDPQTRTLQAIVQVEDPYGAAAEAAGAPLAMGLFVDARIQGREIETAYALPRSALRGASEVYVIQADNTLNVRDVSVVDSSAERVVIIAGIEDGDRVVTSPLRAAADGTAVLVITACVLGFVQYLMLKTGVCAGTEGIGAQGVDLFKASLKSRCFVGGALLYSPSQGQIRLPGTFVAPWQWGWFLISSSFFSFGTAFNDRSPFWRLIGIISLVTVMVMAVVSGQRIALFLVPVVVGSLSVLTGQVANLKRFVPIGVVLGLILVFLSIRNPELIQERIDSFQSRWNASPPHEFVVQQFDEVMHSQEGILGNGVARATNAARIFGEVRLIETYHPKILYELGPLGLFTILVLYTAVTIATFKAYRKTKDKNLRGYAASMWVFILFISYFPYYYPLDVDPVSVYYWLAAGIALKIPTLDKQEREIANPTKKKKRSRSSRKKLSEEQPQEEPQLV
ncbi:MAG: efflux RND transporter periplasmic adaptor subunit [Leptolyngbya sp. SIO3F4]|nr:efflux RND transporter periplasmic adaptor subunit [Leptolyngbya sp. SIO3F4]